LEGKAEMKKLILVAMLSLVAASCGVKNDLTKPDGTTTSRNQPDPSRPPNPIGR
jgi:predicted small lipoprotein YifL